MALKVFVCPRKIKTKAVHYPRLSLTSISLFLGSFSRCIEFRVDKQQKKDRQEVKVMRDDAYNYKGRHKRSKMQRKGNSLGGGGGLEAFKKKLEYQKRH